MKTIQYLVNVSGGKDGVPGTELFGHSSNSTDGGLTGLDRSTHMLQIRVLVLWQKDGIAHKFPSLLLLKDRTKEMASGLAKLVNVSHTFPKFVRNQIYGQANGTLCLIRKLGDATHKAVVESLDIAEQYRAKASSRERFSALSVNPLRYSLPPRNKYGCAYRQHGTDCLHPGGPVDRCRWAELGGWRGGESPREERTEAERHDQQYDRVSPERLLLHGHLSRDFRILADRIPDASFSASLGPRGVNTGLALDGGA